jgi:hypothetical protein
MMYAQTHIQGIGRNHRLPHPNSVVALVAAACARQVWDIRMLKPMHAYFSHNTVTRLDISQRGVLAVGYGRKVHLWQGALREKAQSPYMTHNLAAGALQDFRFCPFEDVLGIGHAGGISTMLVPGAAGLCRTALDARAEHLHKEALLPVLVPTGPRDGRLALYT